MYTYIHASRGESKCFSNKHIFDIVEMGVEKVMVVLVEKVKVFAQM